MIVINYFLETISKKRAFLQIYLLVTVTVIVVISSLGFLYHSNIKQKLTKEYLANGENLLVQSRNTLDHIVYTVYNASKQMHSNRQFLHAVRNNENLGPMDRSIVLNALEQIKSSSEYVDSVALYIKRGNEVYCTDYAYTRLENYPDRDFIYGLDGQTSSLFLVNQRDIVKSISKSFKPPYKVITLVGKVEYSDSEGDKALLLINMDVNKVYKDVIDVLKVNERSEILVVSGEGELVLGNTKSQLLNKVLDREVLNKITIHGNDNKNAMYLGRDKVITSCISSKLLDLKINLIWITYYSTLDNILKSFRKFCMLISVIIILLALFIEIFVIKSRTRQIDELIYQTFRKEEHPGNSRNVFMNLSHYVNHITENNSQLK